MEWIYHNHDHPINWTGKTPKQNNSIFCYIHKKVAKRFINWTIFNFIYIIYHFNIANKCRRSHKNVYSNERFCFFLFGEQN